MLCETNRIVSEILGEDLDERMIDRVDPSRVFNEYLNQMESDLEKLRSLYYQGARNRNSIVDEFVEIVESIEKQSILVREKLQQADGPEDVNEQEITHDAVKLGELYVGETAKKLSGMRIKRVGDDILIKTNVPSSDVAPLFFIDGIGYKLVGWEYGETRISPYKYQNKALSIISDLRNPERLQKGLERLDSLT